MAETFHCPSCGAPLEPDGEEASIHCEYCGETVVVPQELRSKPQSGTANPMADLFEVAASTGRMAPAQRREMMRAIRQGRLDEAAQIFQSGTGVNQQESQEIIQLIANQLSGSGRILPMELAAILARQGQFQGGAMSPTPVYQPAPRRRRSGLGCLLTLVVVGIILFEGVTSSGSANPLAALLRMLTTGSSTRAQATALAPVLQVKTEFAPVLQNVGATIASVSADAAPLLSFGGEGMGPGQFKDARSIAVDAKGRIYAGEYTGGRVQVFDSQGKFLNQWRVDAKLPLRALAVSSQGTVYILQGGKVKSYDGASGKLLGAFPSGRSSLDDLMITPDGKLAAAETGVQDDIFIFEPNGKIDTQILKAFSAQTEDAELDIRVAVDGEGTIYALGSFTNAVFHFARNGKLLNRFGEQGSGSGQFQAPEGIVVDGQGQVYVSDIKGIQVFSPAGRYLKTILLPEGVPFGMAFDGSGNLLVTSRTKIYAFSAR